MGKFEDMSRDELVRYAKQAEKDFLAVGSRMHGATCPFCYGERFVGALKYQVRESVVAAWHKELTQEEVDSYFLATSRP